jgi:hypothetical protein
MFQQKVGNRWVKAPAERLLADRQSKQLSPTQPFGEGLP